MKPPKKDSTDALVKTGEEPPKKKKKKETSYLDDLWLFYVVNTCIIFFIGI